MKARLAVLAAAALVTLPLASPAAAATHTATPIRHFIFLMQGGRTFDNYFATYPGADGPPPGTCQPRSAGRPEEGCVKPFPLGDRQPPPLGASSTTIASQYQHGKMDGFVSAYQKQGRNGVPVMGYYDRRQLPFYWGIADRYVLFDRFFSSMPYGIRANRSYWVSAAPSPGGSGAIPAHGYGKLPTIFDRLQAAGVTWKFYVQNYDPRQTYQNASLANPETQASRVPLVNYARFTHDPALRRHIADLSRYYRDLTNGTLPAVAYIASSSGDNERSARTITAGQHLVRNLTTQLAQSRYWDSSALLVSYDGSGGWFDHVRPPDTGPRALGFRVPALLVSAYAVRGQVNHTVLSYESALRFIEENWSLAPLTARDASANSLTSAFDFAAEPRPGTVLPPLSATPAGQLRAPRAPAAPVAAAYGFYGASAAVSIALVALAANWPWLTRRRLAMTDKRAARTGGEQR
jgi:phospholipase C